MPAALKIFVLWVNSLSKVTLLMPEGEKAVLTSPEIGGEYIKVMLSPVFIVKLVMS